MAPQQSRVVIQVFLIATEPISVLPADKKRIWDRCVPVPESSHSARFQYFCVPVVGKSCEKCEEFQAHQQSLLTGHIFIKCLLNVLRIIAFAIMLM